MITLKARLKAKLATLFEHGAEQASCDTCAFADFFRSNGDGQAARLQGFCRCPGGPFEDRPVPPARRCAYWKRAAGPVEKPRVGDSTLTV